MPGAASRRCGSCCRHLRAQRVHQRRVHADLRPAGRAPVCRRRASASSPPPASLVGLVVQLAVAPLADRGQAKRLLLGGLGLAAVGSTAFALRLDAARAARRPGARRCRRGVLHPRGTGDRLRQPAGGRRRRPRATRPGRAGRASSSVPSSAASSSARSACRRPSSSSPRSPWSSLRRLAPRSLPTLPTTVDSSRPSLGCLRDRRRRGGHAAGPRAVPARRRVRLARGTATSPTSGGAQRRSSA